MASSPSSVQLDVEKAKNQKGIEFHLVKTNSNLEYYYYTQKICNSEEDWQSCLQAMRKELPQSFRVNSARPGLSERYKNILSEFSKKESRKIDVNRISWSDNGTIWQLSKTRYTNFGPLDPFVSNLRNMSL
jgi:hypothetical protein